MPDELNRRGFLAAAVAASCACALSCPVVARADDSDDDDDSDAPAALPAGPVDAGALTKYAKDGPYDDLAKSKQILLVRENGKLYALTALCTHKRFLVKVKDDQFYCPKHSSRFSVEGKPAPKPNGKLGPAKKPLTHYAISLNDKGDVIVDTSKPIDASKLDEAGSFIKVP